MAKRKSISKGRRFDILNRDNYCCRYCGRRPPDVKLVVDHLVPVSLGGDNEPENLVTSCGACNSGKGAKIVEEQAVPAISPESEAELAESVARQRRMLEAYQELEAVNHEIYWKVVEEWAEAFEAFPVELDDGRTTYTSPRKPFPPKGTILSMVDKYGLEIVCEAVRRTGMKTAEPYFYGNATRYTWGVCRGIAGEREDARREAELE